MHRAARLVVAASCLLLGAVLAAPLAPLGLSAALAPGSTPPDPAGWVLTWHDEFSGLRGAAPEASRWRFDLGGSGWGNNELETYARENAVQDGLGHLVISARRLPEGGPRCGLLSCEYSSARLNTRGLFAQAYGRFEVRAQIPAGAGLWPAFWLLGENIDQRGWPACGELDIMENIGREPNVVHGTIHGPGYSGASGIGAPFTLPEAFSAGFHTFGLDWTPDRLQWSVDGAPFQTLTPASLPPNTRWVFDHEMFLILNLAVGGNWPGHPDANTRFPAALSVDWVRVYAPAAPRP